MNRFLLFIFALAVSMSAGAQLYKSVDKDGKVTYSDQPPSEQAKPLNIQSAPATPAAPRSAVEKDKELEKGRAQLRDKAKADEEAARKASAAEENCRRARANLRSLTEGGRIARTDEKGERVVLDDAQIAQEQVKAEKYVAENCKAP